jgi:hypothetical protein
MYFLFETINIFLLLLSIDNISYAYNFLINNYNKKLTYKEIIESNNKTYLTPIFERYLFYGFITITYYLFITLIMRNYIIFVKLLLALYAIPLINNKIYLEYTYIFDNVHEFKNKIIKLIFCDQIFTIIQKLNREYIDDNIILNKDELINILMLSTNIKNEIITFVKNILIVLLLNYFKTKSVIYYKITKYIYMINSGKNYVNNINVENAKKNFIDIFKNKNYDKFNDPMTIHTMLYLYYNKKSSVDWDLYRQKIDYKIISFITLWTIGSFFENLYRLEIMIISALIIKLTRKFEYDYSIIYNIILLFSGYLLSSNIIWLSFCYHFLYNLINNFFVRGIFKTIYNKINYKQFIINSHKNYYSYIKNILIGLLMKYLYIQHYTIQLNFLTLILTNSSNCILEKTFYGLIYIAIINKKLLLKIIILSYIGNLIIEMTRIKKNPINVNQTWEDINNGVINREINGEINGEINKVNGEINGEINKVNGEINIEDELNDAINN